MNMMQRPRRAALSRRRVAAEALGSFGAFLTAHVAGAAPIADEPLSDDLKLRHLLRRTGFGTSAPELEQHRALGLSGSVDQLLNFETVDNSALETRLTGMNLDLSKRQELQRWWMLRMVYTARPLEEKMTLFWHGFLTSAISKVGKTEPMLAQNQFFRTNALAAFPNLLKGVSRDPAMMIWLDTALNRKGHANENYARELMELFSLGIGNYSEQDVREAARAFTGWSLRQNAFYFDRGQHDTGDKLFLGQTGNFDGNGIIDIIVQQPAAATFLARKLFSFFAYDSPTDDVLQPLVDAYTTQNYSVKAMMRALLTSDAFYVPQSYRALVKSPTEFVVGAVRTLGIASDGKGLAQAANQMSQDLFNPPNVAGWHGGSSWLNSGTWLARLNFANRIAGGAGAALASFSSPQALVDHLADLLLDGQISADQRQVLLDYTAGAGASVEERHRGALYLSLAMPEYHLN